MATLESLTLSITQRTRGEVIQLLTVIRAQRRKRPEPKQRKTTAKSKRAASKSSPKTQDLFAIANNMSQREKDQMMASLMEMMK